MDHNRKRGWGMMVGRSEGRDVGEGKIVMGLEGEDLEPKVKVREARGWIQGGGDGENHWPSWLCEFFCFAQNGHLKKPSIDEKNYDNDSPLRPV